MKTIIMLPNDHHECPLMEGYYDDQCWKCAITGIDCEGYKDDCPAMHGCHDCDYEPVCIIVNRCPDWTKDFICNKHRIRQAK